MTDSIEERDLSCQPASNTRLRRLSAQQIERYNQQGFLHPFDIYSPLEAAGNRVYFDWLLAKMNALADGRDSYAINGYHTRCHGIYDMATHPKILDLVEDLLGPNVICWATHFFCKLPHDPKSVPWHQDASYWPLTPSRTVTVWLAIDDADVGNACMHVIPDTHRRGPLRWKETSGPAVLNQQIQDIEKLGEPVPIELKAGQVSVHADMLAHGSKPNYSDRRRCGLTLRYCPPTVRALSPTWAKNAIVCRGHDPTGQWGNQRRPEGDDLSPLNKPRPIGAN